MTTATMKKHSSKNYCRGGKVIQQSVTCLYDCRDGACELYP